MILLFFCSKQKTAYDLRISDWCSACALPIFGIGELVHVMAAAFAGEPPGLGINMGGGLNEMAAAAVEFDLGDLLGRGDRKSVVEGKSVSVRVDLGGARILQQITHNVPERCRIDKTVVGQR